MFVVIYPSRVKPGYEEQFIESWQLLTVAIREHCGANGSRLHRGEDGLFYAYAMWPSAEQRDSCEGRELGLSPDVRRRFREAIEEDLPEIRMTVLIDEVVLPDT